MQQRGSLTVVGTGINTVAQCSLEAKAAIEQADIVLAAVTEPLGRLWIQQLNPNVRLLSDLYQDGRARLETYQLMVACILDEVRLGKRVTAVFYGHPGVFVFPSHESIRRARAEGYSAQMFAAVSAEDCLFADVGFDPASTGCAQYEATAFLFYKRIIDPSAALILWQIGVVGDATSLARTPSEQGLRLLVERLLEFYPPTHMVMLYEAADMPLRTSRQDWLPLADLSTARLSAISTLYIPSYGMPLVAQDILRQLGLNAEDVGAS